VDGRSKRHRVVKTCFSFWIRRCAARTHIVPVLDRCREKGTGAINGALDSKRHKQGARNVVVMDRMDCRCGKSGLRSFSTESSTIFFLLRNGGATTDQMGPGVVRCGVQRFRLPHQVKLFLMGLCRKMHCKVSCWRGVVATCLLCVKDLIGRRASGITAMPINDVKCALNSDKDSLCVQVGACRTGTRANVETSSKAFDVDGEG
jgi:hypothetical protein